MRLNRWWSLATSIAVPLVVMGVQEPTAYAVPVKFFTEFTIPTPMSSPAGSVVGPDGNFWFSEQFANKIGRLDVKTGVITEFPIPNIAATFFNPTGSTFPAAIRNGPDGALWFTELFGNQIGRITVDGQITEFGPVPAIPSFLRTSLPSGIALGSDGAMWFSESFDSQIGRIDVATGQITEFDIPTANSDPRSIAPGADGNLYFGEYAGNNIGRITTAGVITEFPLPTPGSHPYGLEPGPDGNIWYPAFGADKIGRLDLQTGVITEFSVNTPNSQVRYVVAGPDGNIWFTELAGNRVGVLTTEGQLLAEFTVPSGQPGLIGIEPGTGLPIGTGALVIASAPDGNLYFTESGAGKIGRVNRSSRTLAGLDDNTLTILGNPGDDRISIEVNRAKNTLTVKSNGHDRVDRFAASDVGRIEVFGLGGNDRVKISPAVTIDMFVDGGDGDDILSGGSGNDVLVGRAGRDTLRGGGGRDVMIGGDGPDAVRGGRGDDIVIGGNADHDDEESLLAIVGVWTSAEPYDQRIDQIRTGSAVPALNSTTVSDDGAGNRLTGQQDSDWFFAFVRDVLPDQDPPERVN